MAARQVPSGSNRNVLSILVMAVGAILLVLIPLLFFVLAIAGDKTFQIPGTLLIVSVVAGMGLVIVGAALQD